MILNHYSNINLLWGSLLIEELYRLGVSDVCIAPGSRSTPLTLAAAQHPHITTYCHLDERGLGFFALGLATATGRTVAIITTSGTAVANLHAALIEAKLSARALLVISADRPEELHNCGANQAITQSIIFQDCVLQHINLPVPTVDISPSYLLTTIDQCLAQLKAAPGPAQLNFMCREPLYPDDNQQDFSEYLSVINCWLSSQLPFTRYDSSSTLFAGAVSAEALNGKRVLIIVGKLDVDAETHTVVEWAAAMGWPLLLDCQSSLKGHPDSINYYDQLFHQPAFVELLQQTEVIVQFGARLISKRLMNFIRAIDCEYWLVAAGRTRLDPDHRVTRRFSASLGDWLQALPDITSLSWVAPLALLDKKLAGGLLRYDSDHPALSEYAVARTLGALLPANGRLMLGNSLPVRLFDMFAPTTTKPLQIFTNRGASGIDGLLATAAGIAKARASDAMTLLIGDVSLLHDLNSLILLRDINSPFVIVVLNNDGGAIFNLLPLPSQQRVREQFYQMPHGMNFSAISRQFNLHYYQPKNQLEFAQNVTQSLAGKGASLIEISVSPTAASDMITEIGKQLRAHTFL